MLTWLPEIWAGMVGYFLTLTLLTQGYGISAYTVGLVAAKHGVLGLSKNFAFEQSKNHIRVSKRSLADWSTERIGD